MVQTRPLFRFYFHPFLISIIISTIQIEKSIDCVLGVHTWGRRMVGSDKTTELWRLPTFEQLLSWNNNHWEVNAKYCSVIRFFSCWPSQDVFQLPLIPWIEQGGSILLVILLYYDLCDGLSHCKFGFNLFTT